MHESIHDEFVAALAEAAKSLRPGLPEGADTFYGPMNNVNHFTAVTKKLENLPRTPPW